MSYEVRIKKTALKELSNLPKEIATRISKKITILEKEAHPPGSKKLKGSENNYRIPVGSYRIIYTVYKMVLVIEVIKIGHRRDIYK